MLWSRRDPVDSTTSGSLPCRFWSSTELLQRDGPPAEAACTCAQFRGASSASSLPAAGSPAIRTISPLCKRVRWAVDDAVGLRQAMQDFNVGTQISSEGDTLQFDLVIGPDHRDFQTVLPEQQCACRNA